MSNVAALAVADVGAGVLAVAGSMKVRQPGAFVGFVSTLGLRLDPLVARCVGLAEIVLAVAVLVLGGPVWSVVLGVLYLVLAAISALSVTRGAPSCGCFGASSAPTRWSHVVLDVGFALAAGLAALGTAEPLRARILDLGVDGIAYGLFVGLAVALTVTLMTSAAELAASLRPTRGRSRPRAVTR